MAERSWSVGDYEIAVFAGHPRVAESDVLDFWAREGAIPAAVARERVREVVLTASTAAGELAAVSSTYLAVQPQLGLPMWHFRTFVGAAHRRRNVNLTLAVVGRDHLRDEFAAGRDRRGAGIVYEAEFEPLRRRHNGVYWLKVDFSFIGENEDGAPVLAHFFPGVHAPPPPLD